MSTILTMITIKM